MESTIALPLEHDPKASEAATPQDDWLAAARREGEILHRLIAGSKDDGGLRLLDWSCGSGTRAIGLAAIGYRVTATDDSPAAVAGAMQTAAALGVAVDWGVADWRCLEDAVPGPFDVVLGGGDRLVHLVRELDLWLAVKGMWRVLAPDGLLLLSLPDGEDLPATQPQPGAPRRSEDGSRIVFELWDWLAGERLYAQNHFVLHRADDGRWETKHTTMVYRAWRRAELSLILEGTGFGSIQWQLPAATGCAQPVVTARKQLRGQG